MEIQNHKDSFVNGLLRDGGTADLYNYANAEGSNLYSHIERPDYTNHCVCGVKIVINCYIIHEKNLDIHVVGRCCMKRFLSKDKQNKTCDQCNMPHKNRKDGFCNDCRETIKEQENELRRQRDKVRNAIPLIIKFNEKDEAKEKARQIFAYLSYDGDNSIFTTKTWHTLSRKFSELYPKNENAIKKKV